MASPVNGHQIELKALTSSRESTLFQRMANQDSHDFDPYYKWLGIPPELQPADHYRLLGLRLFEEDPEVIAIAADRQMSHVKTFAVGKYGDQSQALLDELAKAKLCLLNAAKKAAYDAYLLDEVTASEEIASIDSNIQPAVSSTSQQQSPAKREAVAIPAAIPTAADEIKISLYGRPWSRKRPSRNLVLGWYIFTICLAIIGFVMLQLSTCKVQQPPQANKPPINPPIVGNQAPNIIPGNVQTMVSVVPTINGDGFLVQLSNPSSSDTAISYALAGRFAGGNEIQRGRVIRIRRGETLATPISIADMVIAKIQLLRVVGQPGISLDPDKSTALIDKSPQTGPVPADPPQPEQPAKPPQADNKFEGLPATVDLPVIRDIKITTLCEVPARTTLALLSSDSSLVLSGNRLEWREKGKQDLDLIGGLEISRNQLQFRWLINVPDEAEAALRNSLIHLTLGGKVHTVSLRSPEIGEPFRFDLTHPIQRILGNCKHLPDMRRIHFKVLMPNELPSYNGDALPSAGLQFLLGMDILFLEAANVKTHFEIDKIGNVPRVNLGTKFQLPSGESRILTFKQLSTAQTLINHDLNAIAFGINRLNALLKNPPRGQQAALEAEMKAIEKEKAIVVADLTELERVVKLARQLNGCNLPYRFFTIVDQYEVDLIIAK